jgi:predicted Ser/Thr protein kinase
VTDPAPDRTARDRINQLFMLALDARADEREQILSAACPEDPAVRDEVRALLSAHDRGAGLLESPHPLTEQLAHVESSMRLVGQRLGQYEVKRVLGEGGMGVVYLAYDHQLHRPIALKAIAPAFANDQTRRARLAREARAVAPLVHPGIAAVYALEEFDGAVYIAGEYVEGNTLRDEIANGALGARRTLQTAIELAEALAAAHHRGIVHRDLKPENVIRTPDGNVKILDFGLAQIRDPHADAEQLTDDGTVLGTPGYMSPEQIRTEVLDARSDLFSLGIIMLEMLTGRHPFKGDGTAATVARILEAEPEPLSGSRGSGAPDAALHREIEGIARICLHKSRDGRFSSAQALLSALQRAQAGVAGTPHAPASAAAPLWWWKFHQAAASVGYLLLLIPMWAARGLVTGRPGTWLFVGGMVAAVAATIIRCHLWFTASSLPAEWRAQQAHTRPWLRTAEVFFVLALVTAGWLVLDAGTGLSELLMGSAVAVLIGFALIEPAATRAAFGRQ